MEDYFEHQGVFLHFSMFLNFIKGQGNKEQQAFWSEKARDGDFIGIPCPTHYVSPV
jgi:hypothetical protein